uniref:Uncharacterized protein n=1 Tax=Fagus sylvatica TaxID=28930 RepID=A0A2N9FTL5_FAGSY
MIFTTTPGKEEVTDLPSGMEEMAVSGNERGGNRLPIFNHRRLQSEVRVLGGQEECEVQRSRGRTEGSAHIPESPLSSEKPERKGGSRNSKKNSSS